MSYSQLVERMIKIYNVARNGESLTIPHQTSQRVHKILWQTSTYIPDATDFRGIPGARAVVTEWPHSLLELSCLAIGVENCLHNGITRKSQMKELRALR